MSDNITDDKWLDFVLICKPEQSGKTFIMIQEIIKDFSEVHDDKIVINSLSLVAITEAILFDFFENRAISHNICSESITQRTVFFQLLFWKISNCQFTKIYIAVASSH